MCMHQLIFCVAWPSIGFLQFGFTGTLADAAHQSSWLLCLFVFAVDVMEKETEVKGVLLVGCSPMDPLHDVMRSQSALTAPQSHHHGDAPKYIVRSDGTLRFLKDDRIAMQRSANPTSQSVDYIREHLHAKRTRSKFLSPLAPTPTTTGTSTPVDVSLEDQMRAGSSSLPAAVSPQRHRESALSFDEAALKGTLAPQDSDIQRIAARGINSVREEEDARLCIPAASLGLRQSAIALEVSLSERMKALKAKSNQMSRFEFGQRAQRVFNDIAYELIRQVGVQSAERAKLLATVWVRSSEIINALSAMFLVEQERHATEESRLKEELRRSRKDYLTVVERLELMVEQENQNQTTLLAEAEEREAQLCDKMNVLKDELQTAKSRLQQMELEKRLAVFQLDRPLARADAYGLEKVVLPSNPSSAASSMPTADGGHSQSGPGRAPSETPTAKQTISGSFYDNDATDANPATVAALKAELQRQRVLLLDAAEEVRKLRGDMPNTKSVQVEAKPTTADVALEPCEELATESDSDDEEEAAKATAKAKAKGRRKGK